MLHLLDLTPEQLKGWLAEHDLPGYRAAQIRQWLFERSADGFEAMTDLARPLRSRLAEEFRIWTTEVVARQEADDGTEKLLLALSDGERIECVLLRDDKKRRTICISTQAGCAMGCAFCASGLEGVKRNLTAGELVEEMLQLKRLLPHDERLSHVVVMGMGEPLLNLDALLHALATATDPEALAISARRITISTVGLPGPMRRLAEHNAPYHLAVSLHAPDDELRNRLVPSNRKVGIAAILAAADHYFERTGRRITYEYVLLAEVNDQLRHARRLVELLRGRPALVNVIPYNRVSGLPYRTPPAADSARFVEILREGGLNAQLRYRKGDRIAAACGQLRGATA
ncbi:MAG: 23S rRNA (adenine(2503)-C(2))-methyltransferase RlmN [Planctomycetota bacterium]